MFPDSGRMQHVGCGARSPSFTTLLLCALSELQAWAVKAEDRQSSTEQRSLWTLVISEEQPVPGLRHKSVSTDFNSFRQGSHHACGTPTELEQFSPRILGAGASAAEDLTRFGLF